MRALLVAAASALLAGGCLLAANLDGLSTPPDGDRVDGAAELGDGDVVPSTETPDGGHEDPTGPVDASVDAADAGLEGGTPEPEPEPVTVTLELASGADDGLWYAPFASDGLDAHLAALWPGFKGRNYTRFRLPSNLDATKPVITARLRFTSRNADGVAHAIVRGYKGVNAPAPEHLDGNAAMAQLAKQTSASVTWDMPATAKDEVFSSPNLDGVINELVALGNGPDDSIVLWSTEAGSTEKDVRAFETGTGGRPVLELTYRPLAP